MLKDIHAGLADVQRGLSSWRTWWMLAWNDVRRRYRRSGLGQFWLTLSMAATIGGLGYVYSHLFGVDVSTYLPYIAVTFTPGVSFRPWSSKVAMRSAKATCCGKSHCRDPCLPVA